MSELMKHQLAALERYIDRTVIPLFFDPGCGKTCTALSIAYAKYLNNEIDCLLVIAPNGVDEQWIHQEIPKWLPAEGYVIQDNKKTGRFLNFVPDKLNICCINIDKFSTTKSYLTYVWWANEHRTMIVVDEATKIKNPKSKRTERLLYSFNKVVRRGKAILNSVPLTVARCILTGTPITNGPFDVWSMFEFLQPGYFGMNYYLFQNHFGMLYSQEINGRMIRIPLSEQIWQVVQTCTTFEQANSLFGVNLDTYDWIKTHPTYSGPYKHVEDLRKMMMKDAMFVKIEDIQDMPERRYVKRLLAMDKEQQRVYDEMEANMIAEFEGKEVNATTKLTMMLRLQQIASGFIVPQPELVDIEDPDPNQVIWLSEVKSKAILLDLEELRDRQVIIVTHFTAEATKLYEELTKEGYTVCLQTGWKKVGTIADFQEGKYQILLANIKVIAMGFNLQNAYYMLFYSNTFSLEDRIQVEARTWRTGQKNRCFYYDYIMNDSIDMKVIAALRSKKNLSDYVRNKSAYECLREWDDTCKEEFKDIVF
jgi:SNF2 family DNA or RNA helicase